MRLYTKMQHLVLVPLLAWLPLSADADTVATYVAKSKDNSRALTFSYRNDQAVRIDVGDGAYMLVSGAKAYMVSTRNGETSVIDLQHNLPQLSPPAKPKSKPGTGKVMKTGRTETIAGISGEVWELIDSEGRKHDMVVSNDKRVRALGKALATFAKRMGQAAGADMSMDTAVREAQMQGGIMLRFDQTMVLQSLDDRSLPANHYQLPANAKVQQMPKMPVGNMPQMDPEMMKKMQEAMQKAMQQQGR